MKHCVTSLMDLQGCAKDDCRLNVEDDVERFPFTESFDQPRLVDTAQGQPEGETQVSHQRPFVVGHIFNN